MRCLDLCLLESAEAASLSLDEYLARLRRCDDCPHAHGQDPLLRGLLARTQDAARALRRAHAEIRKLEQDAAEVARELEDYDAKLSKLERLQQVSTEQMEVALAEQVARVREQERELEALTLPIIQVLRGVLVLPIIGSLTSARARVLTERLLDEVARTRGHTAIIDVTGVTEIDTATAEHLIRMVGALRLLGAQSMLTGITASVAQALVGLGVELDDIVTVATVQQALARLAARGT